MFGGYSGEAHLLKVQMGGLEEWEDIGGCPGWCKWFAVLLVNVRLSGTNGSQLTTVGRIPKKQSTLFFSGSRLTISNNFR